MGGVRIWNHPNANKIATTNSGRKTSGCQEKREFGLEKMGTSVSPGMQFHAQSPGGHQRVVTVTHIKGDMVTVDGNHPLAGEVLHFEVEVADVREATEEELEHGHVHGPGGHHHH